MRQLPLLLAVAKHSLSESAMKPVGSLSAHRVYPTQKSQVYKSVIGMSSRAFYSDAVEAFHLRLQNDFLGSADIKMGTIANVYS